MDPATYNTGGPSFIMGVGPTKITIISPIVASRPSTLHANKPIIDASGVDYDWIIVSDGPCPWKRFPVGPRIFSYQGPQTNVAGNRQRQFALERAKGDLVVHLDQDCLLTVEGLTLASNLPKESVNIIRFLLHNHDGTAVQMNGNGVGLVTSPTILNETGWWREGEPDAHSRDVVIVANCMVNHPYRIFDTIIMHHLDEGIIRRFDELSC
jgi:hypothetical protein